MAPIKSNLLKQISDSLKSNQAFNGAYPVRSRISIEILSGVEV